MNGKKLCGDCNGSGVQYREVQEVATGHWTKQKYTCSKCHGRGFID